MNAPKIMASALTIQNCLDVPELVHETPEPNTDAMNSDLMNNLYLHEPALLYYFQTQISIPFVPATKLEAAANV